MPNLFPSDTADYEIDEETVLSELDQPSAVYKPGPYFDFETGDLLMDGSGKILIGNEVDAWKNWCEKTIQTPRFQCKAYSTDIGIDYEEIFNSNDRSTAEAIITSEISDALSADPSGRTAYVESVTFDWISPDSVSIVVSVVGTNGSTATINSTINNT